VTFKETPEILQNIKVLLKLRLLAYNWTPFYSLQTIFTGAKIVQIFQMPFFLLICYCSLPFKLKYYKNYFSYDCGALAYS